MIRHTVFVRMSNDEFGLETPICPSHSRLLSCQLSLFNLGLGAMWRLLAISLNVTKFLVKANKSYKSRLNRKLKNVGRQYIRPSNVTVAGGAVGSITESLYLLLLLF